MNSKHNVVIFGAGGKVGSLLVKYALAEGYSVTAFIHRRHNLPDHPALSIFRGDVHDADQVMKVVKGKDAVLSALGSWGTKRKDVLSSAIQSIIPAMEQHGVKRIISLTGAEARADGDELGIIHRAAHSALGIVAGKVLRDGERHIQLLEKSHLDWTVIRSPVMFSSASFSYRLSRDRPTSWAFIQRSAVARAMIDQLSNDEHVRRAVFIHKSK